MPYPLKPLECSWPFTIWHEIKSILLLDSSGSNDGWKSESVYFPVDDGHSLMADATDVKRAHFCWFWIVLPCVSARERRKLGKKGQGGAAVSRKCSKDQEKLSVGPGNGEAGNLCCFLPPRALFQSAGNSWWPTWGWSLQFSHLTSGKVGLCKCIQIIRCPSISCIYYPCRYLMNE